MRWNAGQREPRARWRSKYCLLIHVSGVRPGASARRAVAAPVQPPEVRALALERLVQREVGVELARGRSSRRPCTRRAGRPGRRGSRRRRPARRPRAPASPRSAGRVLLIDGWMLSPTSMPCSSRPAQEARGVGVELAVPVPGVPRVRPARGAHGVRRRSPRRPGRARALKSVSSESVSSGTRSARKRSTSARQSSSP